RLHTPPRACAADHPSKVVALTGFAEIATPNLPQINPSGYNYSGTELIELSTSVTRKKTSV
ncbi:MAG TPA: hypothetical protein VMT53_10135, partial [Terriglobales bacterium]|nr:hypothetical protein [Terriglobales bacterium]